MSKLHTYTIHPDKSPYCDVNPILRVLPHFTNVYRFRLQFDDSVKYWVKDTKKQWSWHKACGIKELTLKDNSARVGFRWDPLKEELEFCLYVHCNGVNLGAQDPPVIYSTKNVHEEITGCIIAQDDLYGMELNGEKHSEVRGGGWLAKYYNWPYLEADLINPKPVKIKLQIL